MIADNKILASITVVGGILSVINNTTGFLDLKPLFIDLLISSFLLSVTYIWSVKTAKKIKTESVSQRIILVQKKSKHYLKQAIRRNLNSLFIIPILVFLTIWSFHMPITHLMSPKWFFCGTIKNNCKENKIVEIFDAKGREIITQTIIMDDSDYFKIEGDWYRYKPVSFKLRCKPQNKKETINDCLINNSFCDGKIDIH